MILVSTVSLLTHALHHVEVSSFEGLISYSKACYPKLQLRRRANSIVQSIHLAESENTVPDSLEGVVS